MNTNGQNREHHCDSPPTKKPDILLGKRPEDSFRPSLGNRIAGPIVTFSAFAAALICFGYLIHELITQEDFNFVSTGMLFGGGVGCLICGWSFGRRTRVALSMRVEVNAEGLSIVEYTGSYFFPWAQITKIVEDQVLEYLPGVPVLPGISVAMSSGKSRSYAIYRNDGMHYQLNSEVVQGLGRLRRRLLEEAQRHVIAWHVVQHDS